nr:MAG: cell division topological specificity factor MinE [Chloroflexota bacterium]
MLGRNAPKGSSSKAKERLQFVLVHDRINLPPEQLEAMKQEILRVISKYVRVDDKKVDIALQQRDRDSLLVAEIPFQKRREREEPEEDEIEGKPQLGDETPPASNHIEGGESGESGSKSRRNRR